MSFDQFKDKIAVLSHKTNLRAYVTEDTEKGLFIARFSDGTIMTTSPSCLRVRVRKGNFSSIVSLPA